MTTASDQPELPPRDPLHHPRRLLGAAKAAGRPLLVQAPMVRYSKLPFRCLVRDYGVDLCYTPMLLAKEFVRSQRARTTELTTHVHDRPLVVQFAAHTVLDFARAASMVQPYADGVNLNCGCPQSWALAEGVGCALMKSPELVRDMVSAAKARCGNDFCVSVKIRIHADLEETERFVGIVEQSGVDYITVHGRTRSQRSSEPVNLEAIRRVKEVATVPVIANGDVFSRADVERIVQETGVDGVMAARGLMENPALYAGYARTPWGAVERFLHYAMTYGLHFRLIQHHVAEMMDGGRMFWNKKEKAGFVACASVVEMLDWLDERVVLRRMGEEGFGEGTEPDRRIEECGE